MALAVIATPRRMPTAFRPTTTITNRSSKWSPIPRPTPPVKTPMAGASRLQIISRLTTSWRIDNADEDFGSGAPLVLPNSAGIPNHPHLLVAAGKEGKIYLVDRDNMGKFNANGDNVVNAIPNGTGQNTPPVLINGLLSTPAYFQGELYAVSGYNNTVKAYLIGANGVLQATSQTANASFGFEPGSVVISANGNHDGVVWIIDRNHLDLHAYDARTLNTEIWNSNQKQGDALDSVVKFAAQRSPMARSLWAPAIS